VAFVVLQMSQPLLQTAVQARKRMRVSFEADRQSAATKRLEAMLDQEGVAYDINGYRDAPPGLRLWAGATMETADMAALLPWLDWAYAQLKQELQAAA
jgi:phosphoserine aminotransferase